MTVLPLIYAKATLNTYRSLYPLDGIPEKELEGLIESRFQSLLTRFVEENFAFLPDEIRAVVEVSSMEVPQDKIRRESKEMLAVICGFVEERDRDNKLKLTECEKRVDSILKYIM